MTTVIDDTVKAEDETLLDGILKMRERVRMRLAEKTAIAGIIANDVDRIIFKLDSDLAAFETELKVNVSAHFFRLNQRRY
jgi:hypothetical protein